MKKQILKYTLPIIIALGFSACGEGGGSNAYFGRDGQVQIDIDVECETNPTLLEIKKYITLLSGDTISKSGEDVTIVTYHNIDETKKVCKDKDSTGSAYVLR